MIKKLTAWLLEVSRKEEPQSAVSLPLPPGPIGDFQLELTDLALQIADTFGHRLDFSHDSIEIVETILARMHRRFQESQDKDGLEGVALEFGAYIATTIQHNFGDGVLLRDHSDFGEASFPFEFSGGTIFPYGWCAKRIFDGPGDNGWTKYQSLVLTRRGPK